MFYLFLAEGFEETEALATLDVMRRARLNVQTVGVTGVYVTGSHGVTVKPDIDISDITYDGLDGVVLPGGMPGTINLGSSDAVIDCVRYSFENKKITAAICAAPSILGKLGFLAGRNATCFPGFESELKGALCTGAHVETDEHVITSKGAGCAIEFGLAVVGAFKGAAYAEKIGKSIMLY